MMRLLQQTWQDEVHMVSFPDAMLGVEVCAAWHDTGWRLAGAELARQRGETQGHTATL